MALINGSPCATALAADVTLHAGHRLRLAEAIFALSIEALAAPLDAYDEALDHLRGDEAERTVLHHLRGHLRGAVASGRLTHQAPVSYRILPQVLGQAQRAVQAVAHAAATALGSVTENPVYLPASEGHPFGRVLSTGGFHNGAATPALNWLTASWADLALVAQRQVTAMHSATSGLPHLLAPALHPRGLRRGHQSVRLGRDRAGRRSPVAGRPHPAARHHQRHPERHRHVHVRRVPQAAPGRRMPGTASSPSWPWSPARRCPSPAATRHHPWPDC